VAKSNRRRKQDRARREARSSRKRAAAQRRRVAEEVVRVVMERYDRIIDPGTPPAELAVLLAEQYDGQPVSSLLAEVMLKKGSSPERLADIAAAILATGPGDAEGAGDEAAARDATLAGDVAQAGDAVSSGRSPSLTALTFAAAAARAGGDTGAARQLLDRALAAADDPDERTDLADHLRVSGRLAEAIELLEGRLRDAPDDDHAAERYGTAIEEAYAHVHEEAPDACPCGSGRPWRECCGPRELAALSRFTDRSGLSALRDAVGAHLLVSGYDQAVDGEVAEWLSLTEDLDWEPAERAAVGELAAEVALLTAGLSAHDEADEDEDDADTALAVFAADLSVPAELAARAAAWRQHIHYGLWQVDRPRPEPGLWCTDIVSGVTRYAEFPAETSDGMPRWAVWLGGLVPVDGIWRCTGQGARLSPVEADAAADLVREAVTSLASGLAGKRRKPSRLMTEPLRFGQAAPHGVYVDFEDPASADAARFLGKVTAALLSRIVAEVHMYRSAPPALRNTDGDEMCLLTARIRVSDSEQVAGRLAARPDFERDAEDPARITWYGQRIPEAQRAAMLAEAMAQLRAEGYPGADIDEPRGPERWIRGTLEVRDGEIVAEVNSRERLTRLLDVLARIGAHPVITDEKRVDPAQDFAWPAGPPAFARGAAPAAEGWEKHWLDEHVPALHGHTPRQAAVREKERPLLEALLRQFEYEAGLLAADGKSGIDTGWLRRELDMDDD
jgi:tetratricopeptide (TPR) repeat protein